MGCRWLIAVGAGLVLALPSGAAGTRTRLGGVGHETAKSGAWTADLTWVKKDAFTYTDLHLTLLHGANLVLDEPVTSKVADAANLGPEIYGGHEAVVFRDVDGDGTPELLLALDTGGAHCCSIEQVFDLRTTPPRKTEMSFGDAGATIKMIGGHTVFVGADDSFAYVFTDYADSGAPIAIWRYRPGSFLNVTSSFRSAISADATSWWRYYQQGLKDKRDARGVLAAWAADEARLGQAKTAKQTLLRLAFTDVLDRGYGGWKGSTYVRQLWKFLGKEGYLG